MVDILMLIIVGSLKTCIAQSWILGYLCDQSTSLMLRLSGFSDAPTPHYAL